MAGRLESQTLTARAGRALIILPGTEHVRARYHRDMLVDVSCLCSLNRLCMHQPHSARIDHLSYHCDSFGRRRVPGFLPSLNIGVAAGPINGFVWSTPCSTGMVYLNILGRHNKRYIRTMLGIFVVLLNWRLFVEVMNRKGLSVLLC